MVSKLAAPVAEVGFLSLTVDVGSVRGVPDHHRATVRSIDENALMADRVAWRGDDADALGDLRIAVHQLEPRAGEVEPLRGHGLPAARPFQLGSLNLERPVPQAPVPAPMTDLH